MKYLSILTVFRTIKQITTKLQELKLWKIFSLITMELNLKSETKRSEQNANTENLW
jgi:hypothetical protein